MKELGNQTEPIKFDDFFAISANRGWGLNPKGKDFLANFDPILTKEKDKTPKHATFKICLSVDFIL